MKKRNTWNATGKTRTVQRLGLEPQSAFALLNFGQTLSTANRYSKGTVIMSKSIYDLHRSAFSNVSAYVVMKEGNRVASIAFKFPKDGASKLWAYVHWYGVPMVRGSATGYGYDKGSAACASAAMRIAHLPEDYPKFQRENQLSFLSALVKDSGETWETQLRKAGFEVYQAV